MPANIAECRIFLKFDEVGNRIDTLIEDHNLKITPKKPIIEYEQGEEIFLTIPAHGDVNDNAEAISVPETKIPTGQYKQVEKVVGYTDEIFEPSVEGFIEVNYDQYLKMSGNASDGKEYRWDNNTGEPKEYVYVPSLEELKEQKLHEIKLGYIKDLYLPVWVEQTDGKVYGYDTDKDSQVDFMASYNRAKITGTTRYNVYVNKDDLSEKVFTVHNPEMFEAALSEAGIYQESVYAKLYELEDRVENAKTEEDLVKISW